MSKELVIEFGRVRQDDRSVRGGDHAGRHRRILEHTRKNTITGDSADAEDSAIDADGDRSAECDRTYGNLILRPVFATKYDDIPNGLTRQGGRYPQERW